MFTLQGVAFLSQYQGIIRKLFQETIQMVNQKRMAEKKQGESVEVDFPYDVRKQIRRSFILIMRSPFIDRVPILVSLIRYFAEKGYKVDILSPTDPNYMEPTFLTNKIKFTKIRQNVRVFGSKFRFPVSIGLVFEGCKNILRFRPPFILGGDNFGNIIAGLLATTFRIPLVTHCLELPAVRTASMSKRDQLEHFFIRRSDLVLTHDLQRADFICRQTGVDKGKIEIIANGSLGKAKRHDSKYLREALCLDKGKIILLHSGGFGRWFKCLELALAAGAWPKDWCLVFHTSHKVDSTQYYCDFNRSIKSANILVHDAPVPDADLDQLVSSAHIGIALYSREELGFRADLMGLAAGKIGRYLKNGVPVIATDLPTVKAYISKYSCGLCVEKEEDIFDAVRHILNNYQSYCINALRCYDELWSTEQYCETIISNVAHFK